MPDETITEGSAHGRFQPFHNEHLEYVLTALQRCKFLWIGITKYDLELEVSPLGRDREKPESNPLTYAERTSIIAESLTDLGITREHFAFIPFPIEHAHKLKQFLSNSVTCFTTICEDWNREKIGVLKQHGYPVEVLWERTKKITGREIRDGILRGNDTWKQQVPPATVRAIHTLDIRSRLQELRSRSL